MDLSLEQLAEVPPSVLLAAIPDFLASHIDDAPARAIATERTRALFAELDDDDATAVRDHLLSVGQDIALYPAHPVLRQVSRAWCEALFTQVSVTGADGLRAALQRGPVVVIGNHLSYVDSQATDAALALCGHPDLANALVTVAGPKVYDALFRRFAAGCLSTLPVPQSGAVSNAGVSPRDLARQAIKSLSIAKGLHDQGRMLQIYPEGTRTRTGRMGSFLKGVHRYLAVDGCQVVPMSHSGTDRMFPIGSERLSPAAYEVCYGTPFDVVSAGSTRDALAHAWQQVADGLPPRLKPADGTPPLA